MHTEPPEAAFRDLYNRTSTRVYAYVRRQCDDSDCDDVIAEVYLAAWRHYEELPDQSMPWLLGTAKKVLANHWRSRGRRQRLATEVAGLDQLAAPDCANQAVERADLLQAMSTLSADDREVLLLAGWDGLDSFGVAAVLDCSAQAARARLSRARRRLARQLNERGEALDSHLQLVAEAN
jgi:RNA polymerase sigma-70 factor (ECF subfamily)